MLLPVDAMFRLAVTITMEVADRSVACMGLRRNAAMV